MNKVRKNLIKARKKKKLSQRKVAEILEISRSFYSQIETGSRNPSHKTGKKISLLFNLDINNWD